MRTRRKHPDDRNLYDVVSSIIDFQDDTAARFMDQFDLDWDTSLNLAIRACAPGAAQLLELEETCER